MSGPQEIILAEPRGFCAGVDRAIEIVERALGKFGAPIYVRHEIVHNTYVVNELKEKGAIFIEDLDDVPPGANPLLGHQVQLLANGQYLVLGLLGQRCDSAQDTQVQAQALHG